MNRIPAYAKDDQVCQHKKFKGDGFPEKQILWLKHNIPEHCTLDSLFTTFGDHTDSVLGTKIFSKVIFPKSRPTIIST